MFTAEQLAILLEVYSKENLERGLFFLTRKFFADHPFETWGNFNPQSIISLLNSKKTFNKAEMLLVSFAGFQNEIILQAFLQSLPTSLYKLIGKLLFEEEITDGEASAFLNEEIVKKDGYNLELKREFYFFIVKVFRQYISYSNYQVSFTLSLHPVLKTVLVNFFPKPLYYNLIPVDEVPETDFRFNAEQLIQQELPRLLSYHMQQNIKYNSSGRPADATLTKLQRVCTITEFYANGDAEITKVRSMLMAGMLYAYSFNALTANNADVLRDIFNSHYFKLNSPVFVLQQLKGWQHIGGSDFYKNVEKKLQDVFKLLPPDKWISFENLLEYLNSRIIDIRPITLSAARNYLTYEGIYMRSDTVRIPEKKDIDYKTYDPMVKKAFVEGAVFLYAAFGLIEVAYNNINTDTLAQTYYSAYDGLQHLRLTPLGAYVLGVSKDYENTNTEKVNKLTFDEDSMIILAEGDLEVINVMLANYAERLAANRYRLTSASFLKDCKNLKDILNKIALFKSTVGKKLPDNWEAYFTQLLNNTKAIKEKHQINVYQLPANSKDLHRIIAQDNILKQLILKAENFYILVTGENISKFKNRMKELGYIIE